MSTTATNSIADLDFEVADIEFPTLTLNDRCDSCRAAAKTAVLVSEDLPMLLFCGNHLRKYRAAFDAKGYPYMLNEDIKRDVLFELPPVAGANKPYAGMD